MKEAFQNMVQAAADTTMHIRNFVRAKWASGIRARIFLLGLPLLLTGVVFFLVWKGFFGSYSLSASVSRSIQMAPSEANWVIYSREPGRLFRDVRDSRLARGAIDSEAWASFTSLERFDDIRSVLYLLGLKTGLPAEFADLLSFPGEDAMVAGMGDGSFLVVFRADLKSRMGAALLSAFRGETVPVEGESSAGKATAPKATGAGSDAAPGAEGQQPSGDQTAVSEKSFTDPLAEEKSKSNGVIVSRFRFENRYLYMVLLGDYLFIADSLPTLHRSLELATDPGEGSLSNVPGMEKAMEAERSGGRLVAYIRLDRDPYLPYLRALSPSTGRFAFVFFSPANEVLSARIFAVGEGEKAASPGGEKSGGTKEGSSGNRKVADLWADRVPSDLPALFYSRDFSAVDSKKRVEDLPSGEANRGFAEAVTGFFGASGISPDQYFKDRRGLALLFHGLRRDEDLLLPDVTVGFEAATRDDRPLTAVFRGKALAEKAGDGSLYTLQVPAGFHYSPALWSSEKASFLSTREEDLKTVLATKDGNRPAASDLKSYALLGEYRDSPVQLIVRLPLVANAIRDFYYYGADLSANYSRVTVDRDIVPLLSPLNEAGILHMALRENGTGEVGRLVVTGIR